MSELSEMPEPSTEYLRSVRDVALGLLGIAERLRQHWGAHAAALGMSGAQVKVLLSLVPGEPVPMRSLAERLDYDASNLTTLVDRLQRRGAIERRPDPVDRRVKALLLTPEGENLRAVFWRDLVEDPGPLAPLDETDICTLARLLAALDPKPTERPAAH